MQIGPKTTNIRKAGLVNTARNVNVLRNLNLEQKQFIANTDNDGVNIALRNPYEVKTASFYSSKSLKPSEGSAQKIIFASEQRDYIFEFDNDASESNRQIITMPGGGKFLIIFTVAGSWGETGGSGPDDPQFLQLTARLTSSGSTVSDAVALSTVFVPGKHYINKPPAQQFMTDITINFAGETFQKFYSTYTLSHLSVDFSSEKFYDQGCSSAIIDVEDLNSDHELQLSVSSSIAGDDGNFLISASGTGMTIIGPISYGINEND
jgi:hypothetical protein